MATITYNWTSVVPTFFMNDSVTAGNQHNPAIASNAARSRYFGAWDDPGNEFIEGRIVNSNGSPVATEFLVNSTTTNDQFAPSIAGLNNGNFVTTFTDLSADPGGDIRARIFNSSGTAVGNDFLIASGTDDQRESDVAALAGGGFVVSWTRDFGGGDFDLRAQTFNAAGTAVSGVITVDNSGALATNFSSVAGLTGGGFVVAWQQTAVGGGSQSVWFQRYDAAGVAQGGHVQIDNIGTLNNDIQVLGLVDGGFAVAYTDNGWGFGDTEITFKIFNANGSDRTGYIRVNTATGGNQSLPSLTQLSNGFIVVGFSDGSSLFHQAYDPSGNAAGANSSVAGSVIEGEIAGLTGGLVANVRSSTITDAGGDNSIRSSVEELTRTVAGDGTNELLSGDSLRDTINGAGGGDFIDGGTNADALDGGAGFDSVSWFSGTTGATVNLTNQAFNGGAAAGDTVSNFEAYYLTNFGDVFTGANTGIFVYGFGGADTITTGSGSDVVDGGTGGDSINTGGGFDYVSWNSSAGPVTVNLQNQALNAGGAAGDTVSNAEAFYLSEFGDSFVGQNGQNFVFAQGGNDTISGGSSSGDWLFGGTGNDLITGDTLNDLLSGEAGADTYALLNYFTNGLDQVLNFTSGSDRFQLTGSGFGLAPGSTFTAGFNFIASAAPTPVAAGGTLLYNTSNGFLSYDIDGTGGSAAVALLQIAGAPVVQASDFIVV